MHHPDCQVRRSPMFASRSEGKVLDASIACCSCCDAHCGGCVVRCLHRVRGSPAKLSLEAHCLLQGVRRARPRRLQEILRHSLPQRFQPVSHRWEALPQVSQGGGESRRQGRRRETEKRDRRHSAANRDMGPKFFAQGGQQHARAGRRHLEAVTRLRRKRTNPQVRQRTAMMSALPSPRSAMSAASLRRQS